MKHIAELGRKPNDLKHILITHADGDHVTGLVDVLRRFKVGALLVPEAGGGSAFAALLAEAERIGVPVRIGRAGLVYAFGDGVIEVLGPIDGRVGNENDASVVIRFRYGAADVLFTGDIEAAGEEALARALPSADVLKVAHHGSKSSSAPPFLAAVGAQVAVVSVGEGNRYGHPHPEVIARLESATGRVYRTDRDGTVRLTTDGRRLWLSGERR